MARKTYYTLAVRSEHGRGWGADFGDFERAAVVDEMNDRAAAGIRRRDMKIVASRPYQASIDKAVFALNSNRA